ncbi:hypothetical protein DN594_06875, partial [Enterobacter cloacae]
RGIVFPGKSFFSAHEVSTCKISGCLSYRILDSGPDGTQTTLTNLLNIDSQVDPFDMIAEAREIKDRMEAVRGTDEWTLMINQIRSLDSDWDDDWDGDEESPN